MPGCGRSHGLDATAEFLGAPRVPRHAGERIIEITLAMVAKLALDKLAQVINPYPTQSEAIRMAADAFSRSQRGPAVTSELRD